MTWFDSKNYNVNIFAFDLTVTWHDVFKKHLKIVMSSCFRELSIAAFGGALRLLVRKLWCSEVNAPAPSQWRSAGTPANAGLRVNWLDSYRFMGYNYFLYFFDFKLLKFIKLKNNCSAVTKAVAHLLISLPVLGCEPIFRVVGGVISGFRTARHGWTAQTAETDVNDSH